MLVIENELFFLIILQAVFVKTDTVCETTL